MAEPWEDDWSVVKGLGSGGQGDTKLVKAKDSAKFPETAYVLKTLRNFKDRERRGRMIKEAISLRTIDNAGVPKMVATNATTDSLDLANPIYIVMSYVPGQNLRQRVQAGVLDAASALKMTRALVEIIKACHKAEIIHRDIKPDNIVLRNDTATDPVLVDFGLAYGDDQDSISTITETGMQLGNRFLRLPELQGHEGFKRDERSDLTFCCGVLFFSLTGITPVDLIDEQQNKPHMRRKPAELLAASIPAQAQTRLAAIFAAGFEQAIDARWQSAESLLLAVDMALASLSGQEVPVKDLIIDLQSRMNASVTLKAREYVGANFDNILKHILAVAQSVVNQLGRLQCVQNGIGSNVALLLGTLNINITGGVYVDRNLALAFGLRLVNSQVVLSVTTNPGNKKEENTYELLKLPLAAFAADAVDDPVSRFLIKELEKKFLL